jgi:hypothetical protein
MPTKKWAAIVGCIAIGYDEFRLLVDLESPYIQSWRYESRSMARRRSEFFYLAHVNRHQDHYSAGLHYYREAGPYGVQVQIKDHSNLYSTTDFRERVVKHFFIRTDAIQF